jgi:hypothetical protein
MKLDRTSVFEAELQASRVVERVAAARARSWNA